MVTTYEAQLASHARAMNIEENFAGGMKYTNTPLQEGYMRKLINLASSNDGASLKTRMGLQLEQDVSTDDPVAAWTKPASTSTDVAICHHTTRAYVQDYGVDTSTYVCRYALLGNKVQATSTEEAHGCPTQTFSLDTNTRLIVSTDNGYIVATFDSSNSDIPQGSRFTLKPSWNSIHGKSITDAVRDGVFATYDLNTYMCAYVEDEDTSAWEGTICVLHMQFNATMTAITYWFEALEANDITAVQAVNYGYNMLQSNPYTFTNSSVATSALILDGILPYDSQGNIKTSCRAGTELTFKVAYRYPASHVTAGYNYVTRWTITDNSSENASEVTLQKLRTGTSTYMATYSPGDEISITTKQTSYTNFTLTCYVYRLDQCTSVEYESEALDTVNLTPLNTITVAYSYLTSESKTTTMNSDAVKYNLHTCTGMCTWQERLVLWGVEGAKTTLWVSEAGDPSWFPYPNQIEVFNEPIVAATVYKDTLLVFTDSTLYQLEYSSDGLSYTTSAIQQGLQMDERDASSILCKQNLVFFKNGNYYFMLVPGKYATNQYGEMVLAPVSNNIQDCFDYFDEFIAEILPQAESWNVYDWYCYLEQNQFRIVYNIQYTQTVNTVLCTYYKDIVFQYDCKTRAWGMQTYTSCDYRKIQFISSATLDSTFLVPYRSDTHVEVWTARINPRSSLDKLPWGNTQPECILDTGYRAIDVMHLKKFRQAQFHITTNASEFTCKPTIYVDNMTVFNEDTSYIEDGQLFIEMANDEVTDHQTMDTTIDTTRKHWVADRCCIPFTGRGRLARLELEFAVDGDAEYRPDISELTWVYRTKSGRGGRDGYGLD